MNSLLELREEIDKMIEQGHGDKKVFYRHSSSGDVGPVWSMHVTSNVDECGPFDLEDNEEYVSLTVGGN